MDENFENNGKNNMKTDVSCQSAGPSQQKQIDTVPKMLIEDYTFDQEPETLQNILKFFESHRSSKENVTRLEILAGLVYVLMLEYGFVPIDYKNISSFDFNYEQILDLSKNIPISCKNNVYTLVMYLPSFLMYEVKLAFVTVSEDMLVNCFVKGIENETHNLMLDPLKYFISSKVNLPDVKFQYLGSLSRTFKNTIAFPIKYAILKQNDVNFPCLEDLPNEVLVLIMRKLPIYSLLPFGHCHNRFFYLVRDLFMKSRQKAKASISSGLL